MQVDFARRSYLEIQPRQSMNFLEPFVGSVLRQSRKYYL